jgi:hypothetical protein
MSGTAVAPIRKPVAAYVAAGLALLAAVGVGARLGVGATLMCVAAVVVAVVVAWRHGRAAGAAAALLLVVGLGLVVLGRFLAWPDPVMLVPPIFAIAALLVVEGRPAVAASGWRAAAAVVGLAAKAPVGVVYLTTGLVAPVPDLFGVYAVFAALAVLAVRLARRRSWWVLVVPAVSAGLWFLLMWLGETYLGWQA